MLALSFFHLTDSHYAQKPIWIWIGAHVVYLVIALWQMWVHIGVGAVDAGPPIWARLYFLIQALLLLVMGALLLALPDEIIKLSPWELTSQLAQIYAAPVLCFGVASLKLARARSYEEAPIPLVGMLVFAVAVLIASFIDRESFFSGSFSKIFSF
jgi:hypothetical protein